MSIYECYPLPRDTSRHTHCNGVYMIVIHLHLQLLVCIYLSNIVGMKLGRGTRGDSTPCLFSCACLSSPVFASV